MRSARHNHSTRAQQTEAPSAQQTLKIAPGHLEGCLEYLGKERALVVDGDGYPIDVRRADGHALDGDDLARLDPRDWIS